MPSLGVAGRGDKIKEFGKTKKREAERVPFGLTVTRDGATERHTFTVAPRLTVGEMTMAVAAQSGDSSGTVRGVLRMIRRNLVNDDGVPAQWTLQALEAVQDAVHERAEGTPSWPVQGGELTEEGEQESEREPAFRGPDGVIYPMSDQEAIDRFTAREAGSSRRRWLYLIEEDDDATIDAEDIVEIGKWLVGLAADRPSEPSVP